MWFVIVSDLLLILSFPNFNLNYLVFVAFVPLFFVVENRSPQKAFLISYICGFLFYLGSLYWLYHVTVIGLIVLCLYLALYFGIFGILFYKLSTINHKLFIIPALWAFLEYIQAHLFTGFGWALLGYSQYKNLPFIQIADFSGVYGVSFVIMTVNVAVAESAKRIAHNKNRLPSALCPMLYALLILIFVYTYGFFRLHTQAGHNAIKVSVVQGNIPQELKWDYYAAESILDKYSVLTKIAALDSPDLIIWPETAFPGFLVSDRKLTSQVLDLVKEIKTPLLLGANSEEGLRSFNSAVLISANGEIVDKYDKLHLVPFGEYVPFSDRFPVLHSLVLGELGEFSVGKVFKIFRLEPRGPQATVHSPQSIVHSPQSPPLPTSSGLRRTGTVSAFAKQLSSLASADRHSPQSVVNFAALICFEDIFPEIARKFVKNGAEFLVVVTNDAWYGKSSAPYQHAACSVFRAIENRVPVIRCANTGYSCFIDYRGRIYDAVEKNGTHLFITGHKTAVLKF